MGGDVVRSARHLVQVSAGTDVEIASHVFMVATTTREFRAAVAVLGTATMAGRPAAPDRDDGEGERQDAWKPRRTPDRAPGLIPAPGQGARPAGRWPILGCRPGHPASPGTLVGVPRVVVDVVLKPEISDPQGQAVLGALGRLGHDSVTSVRQGKHFVLEVDGTPDEADLKQIAETLLANPVIEDVELHLPTD
jgi:phosphoribosylformylglycinamidine synthase PurS subunit